MMPVAHEIYRSRKRVMQMSCGRLQRTTARRQRLAETIRTTMQVSLRERDKRHFMQINPSGHWSSRKLVRESDPRERRAP